MAYDGALYQRKLLADMSNIGDPGPLPQELWGSLSDDDLAHIGDLVPPERKAEYEGQGFFPYTPPPAPVTIVSPYQFLLLFTAAEREAIRSASASNASVADWLDLLNRVPAVHLDVANTIAGVQALEAAGLIGTGRSAQILANQAPA